MRGKLSGLNVINGYSAYEVAVINGFKGTEAEWLESLKGEQGKPGKDGTNGKDYVLTDDDKAEIASMVVQSARIGNVTLYADKWVGNASPYSQVVTVDGVTENSQVDLTPNVTQLAIFHNKDLAFVTENEDGVVTVYAIGQKPEHDYTIQVTITEVNV